MGGGAGGSDTPNRLFMQGVVLSLFIFFRRIDSVQGFPDINITPQQLITCLLWLLLLLFSFLHFDLNLKAIGKPMVILQPDPNYPSSLFRHPSLGEKDRNSSTKGEKASSWTLTTNVYFDTLHNTHKT